MQIRPDVDCNRRSTSQEVPGANYFLSGKSRVNQGVIQQNLLPSVNFFIASRGTRTNGKTYLHKGITQLENKVV